MRSKVRRGWQPMVGLLAVGLLAYGLSIEGAPGAPGGDSGLSDRQTVEPQSVDDDAPEGGAVSQVASVGGRHKAKGTPIRTMAGLESDRPGQFGRIVSSRPIRTARIQQQSGTVEAGGDCTCDADCAVSGLCKVANCANGACQETNARPEAECDLDSLFCTDDRCNSEGVCVASTVSPCPSECTDTFRNCDTNRHCASEDACQNKAGVTCSESTGCGMTSGLGRCCDGTCDRTTEGDCGGTWTIITDPDDLDHSCVCPQYSSGISSGTVQPEPGLVVPSPRKCAITRNVCETNDECFDTCVGGVLPGESCDSNTECNPTGSGGVCTAPASSGNDCQDDIKECSGLLTAGDDYALTIAADSVLRLERFRFVGGGLNNKEVITFDFYDNESPRNLVDSLNVRLGHDQTAFIGSVRGGVREYVIEVDCGRTCDDITNLCIGAVGHPFCEARLTSPFIIPQSGHIVARTRRAASTEFGVDDTNFKWMSTDGAVTGGNNAGSIWTGAGSDLGGPGATNGNGGTDVLAFELQGEEILAATRSGASGVKGACCNPLTESCSDTFRWECTHCTGDDARCDLVRGDGLNRRCGRNRKLQICSDTNWKGPRTEVEIDAGTQPGDLCAAGDCSLGACCAADGGCTLAANTAACGAGTFQGLGTSCTPNICPILDESGETAARCSRGGNLCDSQADCSTTLGVCDAGTCYRADLREASVACSVSAQNCPHGPNTPAIVCTSNEGACTAPGTCGDGSACSPDDNCGFSGADCCRDQFECDDNSQTNCTDDDTVCPEGIACVQKCQGPTPINVDVPDINEGLNAFRTTVITGNSDNLSFLEDCSRPGDLHVGWYEHFSVDDCAELTISFCGAEPVYPPQASWLVPSCPCSTASTMFLDRNENGDQRGFGSACNNDFCCGDDNFSFQITVPPGTYQYEMSDDNACAFGTGSAGDGQCTVDGRDGVSPFRDPPDCAAGDVCRDQLFPYQIIIHSRACPPAACCSTTFVCSDLSGGGSGGSCDIDDDCLIEEACAGHTGTPFSGTCVLPCADAGDCDGAASCDPTHKCNQLDEFTCDSLRGDWLGVLEPAVAECSAPSSARALGTCAIGSCCTGPGSCDDVGLNTAAACLNSDPGFTYHGNLFCLPEPPGTPLNANPCPVCPFESQAACQTDTANFIYISDRLLNRAQVDDFRPAGGLINRICWGGCFVGEPLDAGANFECSGTTGGTRPPQAWEVTFYEDEFGLPKNIPLHPTYQLTIDAEQPFGTTRCWDFTAPLETDGVPDPLSVVPEACHWMKLTGLGEIQGDDRCLLQVQSSADGNNLRLTDNNGIFENEDQKTGDLRFCLDSGLVPATAPPASQDGGCGARDVACCLPDGSCVNATYSGCVGVPGSAKDAWAIVGNTCETTTCPALPANDDCADATLTCNAEFADGADLANGKKGQCRGNPFTEPPIPGEVCDPTVPDDCFDGFACTPWPDEKKAYRCSIPSNNVLASKDVPGGTFPCGAMASNIWFEYTAPCSGSMTIRTCKNTGYDGMMAVWVFNDGCRDPDTGDDIVCPMVGNFDLLQCDDDFCPGSETTEGISGTVALGACVKVSVGGFSNENGNNAAAGRGLTVLDVGFLCDLVAPTNPPLLPGIVDFVDHDIRKQRFLSIDPNNAAATTRMRLLLLDTGCSVTGRPCTDDVSCTVCDPASSNAGDACDNDNQCDQGSCAVSGETCEELSAPVDLGFIQDPTLGVNDSPPNTVLAGVDPADPGFRIWDEPLVHIVDCEVRPNRVYRIAVEDIGLPGSFSALDMRTSISPPDKDWGDLVGKFTGADWTPGNQLVNVDDVNVIIKFLTLDPNAPHVTRCEMLSATAPSFVNMDVNASELGQIIKSFGGELFPPLPMVCGGYPNINDIDCNCGLGVVCTVAGSEPLLDCPPN